MGFNDSDNGCTVGRTWRVKLRTDCSGTYGVTKNQYQFNGTQSSRELRVVQFPNVTKTIDIPNFPPENPILLWKKLKPTASTILLFIWHYFGEKLRGTNTFGCICTSLYMDPHTKSDGQSITVTVRFHGGDTGACSRAETASLVHPGHDSRQGKEHFAFLSIGIFFRFSEDTSKEIKWTCAEIWIWKTKYLLVHEWKCKYHLLEIS